MVRIGKHLKWCGLCAVRQRQARNEAFSRDKPEQCELRLSGCTGHLRAGFSLVYADGAFATVCLNCRTAWMRKRQLMFRGTPAGKEAGIT